MNIFAEFNARIEKIVQSFDLQTDTGTVDLSRVTVEPPRDPSHGDLATNAAMVLAKPARTNPRALAELSRFRPGWVVHMRACPQFGLHRERRACSRTLHAALGPGRTSLWLSWDMS